MKLENTTKDNIEKQSEFKKKNELTFLNSWKPIPHLILWDINLIDKTAKKVKFENVEVDFKTNLIKRKKLIVEKNHFYLQALNFKNLYRKIEKKFNIKITEKK